MSRGKVHIRKCIVILGSKTIIFFNTMLWRSESIHTRCYTLSAETASYWTFLQPRVPDKMSNFQCTGLSEKPSLTYMASTFCLFVCLFSFLFLRSWFYLVFMCWVFEQQNAFRVKAFYQTLLWNMSTLY